LVAIAAVLATIALVLEASGNTAQAASSVVNGNFETGDLSGWTVDTTASGAAASAVASYDYSYQVSCNGGDGVPCYDIYTMLPHEGSYFALLTTGDQQSKATSIISPPFEASNGDKVSGWAFFATHQNLYNPDTGANNDKAQVVITSVSGTTVTTPFEQSVSSVGQYFKNTGWRYWEHTFSGLTGPSQFQIEAQVQNNSQACARCSVMGLDDVKTTTAPQDDTTAPSTSITSGPNGPTNNTAPTFTFSGSDNVTTTANLKYQYRLDSGGWSAPSTSTTATPTALSEGGHLFEVRALDEAGNVDASPAQRSFTVDTTKPMVKTTTPSGATPVARGTNLTATFSEKMRTSSVNTSTFKLYKVNPDGTQTQITDVVVSLSFDKLKATLNPFGTKTTLFARNTKYKGVISTGTKDLAGNSLAQQKSWTFTTKP
jgi:hypothetical protein